MKGNQKIDQEFYDYCQSLYEDWLNGSSRLDSFAEDFEVGFLPEPYFRLPLNSAPHEGNCLYVLNNNPGHSLPMQAKHKIISTFKGKSFSAVADEMGKYYDSVKFASGANEKFAAKRNEKIKDFARRGGFNSVMCVETFFLHSKCINKAKFLNKYVTNNLVQEYKAKLTGFLSGKPVLAIAAIGVNRSIDVASINANPWLVYQQQILGVNMNKAEKYDIRQSKKCKVSAAFFVEGAKYISYMMGANSLPKLSEDDYRRIFGKK